MLGRAVTPVVAWIPACAGMTEGTGAMKRVGYWARRDTRGERGYDGVGARVDRLPLPYRKADLLEELRSVPHAEDSQLTAECTPQVAGELVSV